MGRVFGVFLLIFGLGLVAYGLPSAEPEWSPAIEKLTRPAGTPDAAELPGTQATRTARSPGADAGFKSRPLERTPAQSPDVLAPMDKLRAAGQARIGADTETTAIHRPLSSTSKLDVVAPVAKPISAPPVTVPAPVEVVRPTGPAVGAPAASAPSVAAPPVVSAARRESALRERPPQEALGDKPAASTAHPAAGGASRATRTASAAPVATDSAAGQPATAQVRTVTLALSPGPSSEASALGPSQALTGAQAEKEKETSANRKVWAEPAKPAESPKPRVEASARQLLNQRYAPPVFLGKVPQAPPATREASTRRSFKTQDFWEASRRGGM